MKFYFNLKTHCVETEGKKIYESLIRRYFDKSSLEEEKFQIETKMDVLKYFLENADFRGLRSKYPLLSGNADLSAVILDLSEQKEDIRLIMNEEQIVLKKEIIWKKS